MAFSFFLLFELISAFASESYFEVEIVEKLQSVVEKQRGQIKKLEQSNIEFKSDNEEVSNMYNEFHQIKSIHYKRRSFSIFTSPKSNTFVEIIQNIIGMAEI